MKLPDKAWYTIQEVATRWNCSEDDVLHQIQTFRLYPSFIFDKVDCHILEIPPMFTDIQSIHAEEIICQITVTTSITEQLKTAPVRQFIGLVSLAPFVEGRDVRYKFFGVGRNWNTDFKDCFFMEGAPTVFTGLNEYAHHEIISPVESTPKTIDDILIVSKELHRFEARSLQETIHPKVTESYLDPNHNHYSKELAVAVKAWRTLYDKGGAYKANRSHKDQIKEALAGNNLSNAAIERIATLVNPNKDGGAPSTDY